VSDGISGIDLSSGGHVWVWQPRVRVRKNLRTTGVAGAFTLLTCLGERPGKICGPDGGPAWLWAATDGDLNSLEAAIQEACDAAIPLAWMDDQGHSGSQLVLLEYQRHGERVRDAIGHTTVAQRYVLTFQENAGAF